MPITQFGIKGVIATVNNHKKNKVALGFSAFVKNHCFSAEILDIDSACPFIGISSVQFLENKLWIPIQIRYIAPHHLIILKSRIDCEINRANHSIQYVMCTTIHHQNHKAVQYHILLPCDIEFFTATTKSGHGLMSANKCTHTTESNIRMFSIIIENRIKRQFDK